jgi:hypothetical protein
MGEVMAEITRADLDAAVTTLRIEWRQEMIAQTRWIAGLFLTQVLTTGGIVAGVLYFMLPHLVVP